MRNTGSNGRRLGSARAMPAVLVMALEWILLVAGAKLQEMIVGAASVAAAALFLFLVVRAASQRLEFRAADLAAAWRIP